ncbi:MAG TPA: DUF1326 domain-containing protein [Blastocatellia bacterium]|nr:DUF1326 domain-containing protein [Blastocatellia bacterium]
MTKRLLIVATSCVAVLAALFVEQYQTDASGRGGEQAGRWHIKGALSEACTCNVPCTCNFGEGPSPHPFCYVVYAYEIREGQFNDVRLDGLRFGGMETAKGNALYLDSRADGERRAALESLARKVMRINGDRMGGAKLLGIKYVEINQQYDGRGDSLDLGGAGSFKTYYIMGRDKTKPVVVVNNTEWPIHEAIKGKTESFVIKDGYGNQYSARNTNSNHGDFEFDETTRFGSHQACGSTCSPGEKDAGKKHDH